MTASGASGSTSTIQPPLWIARLTITFVSGYRNRARQSGLEHISNATATACSTAMAASATTIAASTITATTSSAAAAAISAAGDVGRAAVFV